MAPNLKHLRQDTGSFRPQRKGDGGGGGAFWWIVGALVVLWIANGGPR